MDHPGLAHLFNLGNLADTGARHSVIHQLLLLLASLIKEATPILRQYGLLAICGILFAESFGVVFAPGESILVTSFFLAAKGVFPLWEITPIIVVATVLGQYAAFFLGNRYGHTALLRYGKYIGIRESMIEKVHRFFGKYGAPVVVIGRFIVPLRQLQGYLAGASEMGWKPFAVWDAIGGILWVAAWGGGTFLLAAQIPV